MKRILVKKKKGLFILHLIVNLLWFSFFQENASYEELDDDLPDYLNLEVTKLLLLWVWLFGVGRPDTRVQNYKFKICVYIWDQIIKYFCAFFWISTRIYIPNNGLFRMWLFSFRII